MIEVIRAIIARLKVDAGDGDMSSVQINSEGNCILRSGLSAARHLTADEFAAFCGRRRLKCFAIETYISKGDWKTICITHATSLEKVLVSHNSGHFWRSETGDAYATGISWRVREATNVEKAQALERHEFLVERAEEQFGER